MELGYLTTCERAHDCWYENCFKEVKKGDPVYRFYHGNRSRGMHVFCALEFLRKIMKEMKGYGRRN